MKDLFRLRKLLRPYRWQVLLSLLVLLLVTATRLVVPAIIGNVIDYGLDGGEGGEWRAGVSGDMTGCSVEPWAAATGIACSWRTAGADGGRV